MARQANNTGANLGFEARLWAAADKLRGNMEPSDYKHVALGLIFLKYISDAFEAKRTALLEEDLADAEDPEEYLAENVFWVPKEARWSHLQARARQPTIGKDLDDAMLAIEARNASLKGVLPKDYARPALNKVMLGELIDLVSGIGMAEAVDRSRDILGRVYEYFLGGFAGAEGKRGGEFYTPRSVVRLLVEMLEPYNGCGLNDRMTSSSAWLRWRRWSAGLRSRDGATPPLRMTFLSGWNERWSTLRTGSSEWMRPWPSSGVECRETSDISTSTCSSQPRPKCVA